MFDETPFKKINRESQKTCDMPISLIKICDPINKQGHD